MTWNYRVIRHRDEENAEFYFQVHECYYRNDKIPTTWTIERVGPFGGSRDELISSIERMLSDAKKYPVLEIDGERLKEVE